MDWGGWGREFAEGVSDWGWLHRRITAEAQGSLRKAKDLTQSTQRKTENTEKDKGAQPRVWQCHGRYSWVSSCSALAQGSSETWIASRGGVRSGAARRYWTGQVTGKPRSRAIARGQYA